MTDRTASGDDDAPAYRSPDGPEDDDWWSLGLKVGLATVTGYLVAVACGFDTPTWSVLTAAFLATAPPASTIWSAGRRALAMLVGVALGGAGAYATTLFPQFPAASVAAVGFVAGALGSRSADYLFAAVVGTVVTFAGLNATDPLAEVIVATACMVLIGCVVGPAVVWGVERARRALAERRA